MIDTPGFDDTNRSDIDTLKTLSSYLSASIANGIRISGIIFLHRISDNRLGNTGFRNLRMFKKLSGTSTWPNTVIGTTMWQTNEYEDGERRERELMGNVNYFGDMLSRGAKLFRIAEHGTGVDEQRHSVLRIVSYLVQRMSDLPAVELEIQRELVLEGKTLDATAAGREALGDLYHLQQQLARQLEDAQREMQEAITHHDTEHAQQLRALEEDCERQIQDSKREQEKLNLSLMEMHEEEMERVQMKLDDLEHEHQALLARKRRELQDMEDSQVLMREQFAIDAARWEKQCLDAATLQKKRRAHDELDRECKQSVAKSRHEAAQQETQIRSIRKARGAMRHNVANGMSSGVANGVTTALTTALGAAGRISCASFLISTQT
ncbi:uncharacterized protein KY384_004528 [Bacidia gigantensis]|uniref:uncharacterized protein n=1 Tax=Bacidia gigantensis TaxID=2732470 RepID=UPI001D04AB41|nr:uncharacterized protein KY384_004528 [Bacidia gigantensis]KAG8531170.1 hypothetical protein KY384_004528 [Bacidia gigantensis]